MIEGVREECEQRNAKRIDKIMVNINTGKLKNRVTVKDRRQEEKKRQAKNKIC